MGTAALSERVELKPARDLAPRKDLRLAALITEAENRRDVPATRQPPEDRPERVRFGLD